LLPNALQSMKLKHLLTNNLKGRNKLRSFNMAHYNKLAVRGPII